MTTASAEMYTTSYCKSAKATPEARAGGGVNGCLGGWGCNTDAVKNTQSAEKDASGAPFCVTFWRQKVTIKIIQALRDSDT